MLMATWHVTKTQLKVLLPERLDKPHHPGTSNTTFDEKDNSYKHSLVKVVMYLLPTHAIS